MIDPKFVRIIDMHFDSEWMCPKCGNKIHARFFIKFETGKENTVLSWCPNCGNEELLSIARLINKINAR